MVDQWSSPLKRWYNDASSLVSKVCDKADVLIGIAQVVH